MFSDFKQNLAGLAGYIDKKERAFEDRCVKEITKLVADLGQDQWGTTAKITAEYEEGGRRLAHLDKLWSPIIPVRFGSQNIVAKRKDSEKRTTKDMAFFEMGPQILFKPSELVKTEMYRDWVELREDGSLDRRSVGLLFPLVGKIFVIHNEELGHPEGICLTGHIDGDLFVIEPLESLISSLIGIWCPKGG